MFKFLARAKQLKSKTVFDIAKYRDNGSVLWFHEVPVHDAVRLQRRGSPEDADPLSPLLKVDRVARPLPPSPGDELSQWIEGPYDDYAREPTLRDEILAEVDLDEVIEDDGPLLELPVRRLTDEPAIEDLFLSWLEAWLQWAAEVSELWGVTELYRELFEIRNQVSSRPDEFELVVGVGLLDWKPREGQATRRHILTCPATIAADDNTGALTVSVDLEGGLDFEDEIVPPDAIKDSSRLSEINVLLRDYDGSLMNESALDELLTSLTYLLDASATYRDLVVPPAASEPCTVFWAPAIVMRKRTERGIIKTLQSVAENLEDSDEIPDGLYPLVDLDWVPDSGQPWTESDGAVLEVDGTIFLPMPVNEQQFEVIRRVDRNAQTVVQGPPGTGKTHTAAALISHLLALGKRVLVTAQTDQALIEVRDKLPEGIQNLAVSVIGSTRDDLAQLEMAARALTERLGTHDPDRAAAEERRLLSDLDSLARERATFHRKLVNYRELEVKEHTYREKSGSLGQLADDLVASEETLGWLRKYSAKIGDGSSPVSNEELDRWIGWLQNEGFREDREEAVGPIIGQDVLVSLDDFRALVEQEAAATAQVDQLLAKVGGSGVTMTATMADEERARLVADLRGLAATIDRYGSHPFPWVSEMVSDLGQGLSGPWVSRYRTLVETAAIAQGCLDRLGLSARVTCEVEPASLLPLASSVLGHLRSGKGLKLKADGTPRTGAFGSRVIKESAPLFEKARVNGVPPTTEDDLVTFLDWVAALRALEDLDRAWPASMTIPVEDTLRERLDWHESQIKVLGDLIELTDEIKEIAEAFEAYGIALPEWTSTPAVTEAADRLELVGAQGGLVAATEEFLAVEVSLRPYSERAEPLPWATQLLHSIASRNMSSFREARERVEHLSVIADAARFVDGVGERVRDVSPALAEQVLADPADTVLRSRLETFEDAWAWSQMEGWLREQDPADSNIVSKQLDAVEGRIIRTVEELGSLRAWTHAVGSGRMTGKAQGYLKSYAQQVRKFGKTGGKYKVQRSAQIRNTLDKCRPSVPVWIMPLYRVVEQIATEPDSFDVVIVDEASQAGLEAIFLQYLAPKIVVIGDDKQVSPANVGLDQSKLRGLAEQYLGDDEFIGNWAEPTRSLFDEAQMRYGGTVTLVEHRRCVPEIIEFCNIIAYEPEGIRLQPVRQLGDDRLPPIVPRFLEDGYREGKSNVNPPEVEAVVEAVLECCSDSRYDGMTFGVISLLGSMQSKMIQAELMQRLPPEEWAARNLRCGEPPAFQGSERDVVFLSMVAAPSQDRRLAALTRDLYVQRYNVAVSRAKDQLWLFHSVNPADLPNPADLRRQLIDYSYGIAERFDVRSQHDVEMVPVPEAELVEPFDSLFEQRVFNRLVGYGYTVVPQFRVQGYKIDLVVQGGSGKLAVECDGDFWHGPAEYEKDLARQRDLERMNWVFHRVRLSKFSLDPEAEIRELRGVLDERGIYPRGWTPPDEEAAPDPPVDEDLLFRSLAEHVVADVEEQPTFVVTDGSDREDRPSETEQLLPPEVTEQTEELLTPEVTEPPEGLTTDEMTSDEAQSAIAQREWSATLHGKAKPPGSKAVGSQLSPNNRQEFHLHLEPYREWAEVRIGDPMSMFRRDLAGHLVDITEVEGPIVCQRLFQLLNHAAGNSKLGKNLRSALNQALAFAERSGSLVVERPLGEAGYLQTTIRLPKQPGVRLRTIGPRPLDHIPPAEIARVVSAVRAGAPDIGQEDVFREVLGVYGKTRLTANVIERLTACDQLST